MTLKVWHLGYISTNYASLDLADDESVRTLWDWGIGKYQTVDKPIYASMTMDEKASDFPSIGISHVPIFSQRAIDALISLIKPNVEVLRLDCPTVEMYALKTVIVDCLDYSKSIIKKHPSLTWLPGSIKHAVFKPNCLDGIHIFRLHTWEGNSVFVSDTFKTIVENEKLEGAYFLPIK